MRVWREYAPLCRAGLDRRGCPRPAILHSR
jgi:hypothetical protein